MTVKIIRISGFTLCILLTEQVVDVLPFNVRLLDNKLLHKVIVRMMDNLLGCAELGNLSLMDNQDFVRERQRLLRVMRYNDRGQFEFSGNRLNPRLIDSLITPSNALSGSSSGRIFGFVTSVLARATLCFCPPDSSPIRLFKWG